MGQIQGAINNVLGTALAATTLQKHIAGQAESNKLAKAEMAFKKAETEKELNALQKEASVTEKEINLLKENKIPETGTKGEAFTYNIYQQDMSEDIQKRNLALRTAQQKIEAKKLQIETYEKVLGGKK